MNDRLENVILTWFVSQQGKAKKATDVAKALASLGSAVDPAPLLDELAARGQLERIESKKKGPVSFALTAVGQQRVAGVLSQSPSAPKLTWAVLSKRLAAVALAIDPAVAGSLKPAALGKLLLCAVVIRELKLDVPLDQGDKAALLMLVKLALARWNNVPVEKVYLKKLPTGELPALVAAPLLGQAGTAVGKIDKLIEACALQRLGITSTKGLDAAILRRWIGGGGETNRLPVSDPRHFAGNVLAAAHAIARDGGPGLSNLKDKVMIHPCWQRFGQMFGELPLDEFKRQLSRANGDGVILVCEDLITDARRSEFAQSEVRVGTSSYHYIRL